MRDTNLNICVSDVRCMLNGDAETTLVKAMLSDDVISIEDALECFTSKDIEHWLEQNADYYGYQKVED